MVRNIGIVTAFFLTLTVGLMAQAQEKRIVLAADPALIDAGLMDYLLPRFSLKTQIRVSVATVAEAGAADAWLAEAPPDAAKRKRRVMHVEDGPVYFLGLAHGKDAAGPRAKHAQRFADWLTTEIGQRTITDFEGATVYVASASKAKEEEEIAFTGDAVMGEKVALAKCGRCHVINDTNRMNGLGSTPSFGALKALANWQDRFLAFYAANPHPAFTQIDGLTQPFDPMRPSPIYPITLGTDEYEALLAFVAVIDASDLGAPVQSR